MRKSVILAITSLLLSSFLFVSSSSAEVVNYDSTGNISYIPDNSITLPQDPEYPNPNHPVSPANPDGSKPKPGMNGPLSIDFISIFDFGVHPISNEDKVYEAKAQKYFDATPASPNYVQVTDKRGTNAGWVLKVEETSQFRETKKGKNPILKGATLSLKDPRVKSYNESNPPVAREVLNLTPREENIVARADPGSGSGTWIIHWGGTDSIVEGDDNEGLADAKVQLFVPGVRKDAASYTTNLLWKLSELPGN